MTSRSISRSRRPIATMCGTLRFTFSTPVISHWTRRRMKSPHWSEALSLLLAPHRLEPLGERQPRTIKIARSPRTLESRLGNAGPGLESNLDRGATMSPRSMALAKFSSVFLRLALGISFLSAVADRFGIWGAYRQPNVSWRDYPPFLP